MKVEKQTLIAQFESMLDRSDDPVLRILVLTYEFDEQQLLNMLLQRSLGERLEPTPTHLANLADLSPVVIYDSCKTKPSGLLPHFLELLPVKAKAWSCHHPKAYLIVTEQQVHLLIGSANLTASGLFTNREVFLAFHWNQANRNELSLLADFAQLVESEYGRSFDSPALRAILMLLKDRIAAWTLPTKGEDAAPRLIASGFRDRPSGLDQLEQAFAEVCPHLVAPSALFIVSPFFDKTTDGALLIEAIEKRFGQVPRKELVTSEDALQTIAKRHLGSKGVRHVWSIPEEVVGVEKEHICAANESAQVEHLKIDRALHAKLLILVVDDRALIYLGSANFSCNAWLGRNNELGVAWWHEGNADALWAGLKKGLGCTPNDRFTELPAQTAVRPDVIDPEEVPLPNRYPDFVKRAELVQSGTARLRFRFEFDATRPGVIGDYRVEWGGLNLDIDNGVSQAFSEDDARTRLFSGRNLLFVWQADPRISYPLPFRHSAAMFDARYEFVHPTPEDWMAHCIGHNRDSGGGQGGIEQLPGDDPLPPDRPDDDREDNPVVRMQRYLSDFTFVEAAFKSRASRASPDRWGDLVAKPLMTFARILERSCQGRSTQLTFQIGELVLLANRLAGPDIQKQALVNTLMKSFPSSDDVSGHEALKIYRAFCNGTWT